MGRSKTKVQEKVEAAEARLTADTPRLPVVADMELLSTGCTLLNLSFSGRPDGGVPKGTYLYIVGSSGSSKTWLTFNLFAEAAINPVFKDYRFIHDNVENGALMDVEHYFGKAVVDRLEPPWSSAKQSAIYSETVQQFYYHFDRACDAGPCIYVLDSMDGLQDSMDEERFESELTRYETGKGEVKGSYGVSKPKTNSRYISRAVSRLRDSGSILVVISQTRDKIGSHIPNQQTRSGGRALKFFAHLEVWTSVKKPLTKTYLHKEREIGSTLKFDVQKNRVSGWEGQFEIEFIKGYGVDDLGTMVNFLLDERHWNITEGKSSFSAPEFNFVGSREKLIKHVQDEGLEPRLRDLTATVWNAIREGALPERKLRYGGSRE